MATNNMVPSDPSQPQELASSQPAAGTKFCFLTDVNKIIAAQSGQIPMYVKVPSNQDCPPGYASEGANPAGPPNIPAAVASDAADAIGSKLHDLANATGLTAIGDFFSLFGQASVWKGIFLLLIGGVLLIVGAQFFKGARDIEGKAAIAGSKA